MNRTGIADLWMDKEHRQPLIFVFAALVKHIFP